MKGGDPIGEKFSWEFYYSTGLIHKKNNVVKA
jgi:hypothetical protein